MTQQVNQPSAICHEMNLPEQSDINVGRICWLFGRSGAGKTTLAIMLADKLKRAAQSVLMVDGDCLRAGLCRDLGFDETSRTENHRRAAELAKLAAQQGFFVIGSTMCPHQDHRSLLREVLGGHLQLIYLDASHEECAQRDTKGLYRQFAAGNLDHFSKDTFHEPLMTERDLTIRTGEKSLLDSYSELEAHFDLV